MPASFITGSHAYGTPNEDSDVDLVVFCGPGTADRLRQLGTLDEDDSAGGTGTRFGKLNLILVDDQTEWEIWYAGTSFLAVKAPVPRSLACRFFAELREMRDWSSATMYDVWNTIYTKPGEGLVPLKRTPSKFQSAVAAKQKAKRVKPRHPPRSDS